MNTTTFLLEYWHLNFLAILFIIGIAAFHYITNGYRMTNKSPRIFIALILFVLVTISPLDYLSKSYLFSAHMVQHIVLLLIIPPLLLTATDEVYIEKVFKRKYFRNAGKFLFYPLVAWFTGVGSMYIMHLPGMAMSITANIQMIILPILGLIFIWPVFTPANFEKLEPLQSALYLFLACVGCTVLGILIAFSPDSMFAAGMQSTNTDLMNMIHSDWGISDSNDQMLGGLIMWVPACIIYLTNIMIVLFRWFTRETV
jgi:cytochrome c oxidase assembly factor CtaG